MSILTWIVKAVFPTPPSPSTTNLYRVIFPAMVSDGCPREMKTVQYVCVVVNVWRPDSSEVFEKLEATFCIG
jgi:hypothetical protein